MRAYTFSRREKALLLVLVVLALGLAWYLLVYRDASQELARVDGELSNVRAEITAASAQVDEAERMRRVIAEREEEGARQQRLPPYDNVREVMDELDGALGATQGYSLDFDEVSRDGAYVRRGVSASFSCPSYAEAARVVRVIARGSCPCSLDAVSLSVDGLGACRATVRMTFFERG